MMKLSAKKLFITTAICFAIFNPQTATAAKWNKLTCKGSCAAMVCKNDKEFAKNCVANCDWPDVKRCGAAAGIPSSVPNNNPSVDGSLKQELETCKNELSNHKNVSKHKDYLLEKQKNHLIAWNEWYEEQKASSHKAGVSQAEVAHLEEEAQNIIQEIKQDVAEETSGKGNNPEVGSAEPLPKALERPAPPSREQVAAALKQQEEDRKKRQAKSGS